LRLANVQHKPYALPIVKRSGKNFKQEKRIRDIREKKPVVNVVGKKLSLKSIKLKMVNVYFARINVVEIGIQMFGLNKIHGKKNREFVQQKF